MPAERRPDGETSGQVAFAPDEQGDIRFGAAVAWASFEYSPKSGPRYRAGIEFINANPAAVDAYSSRHKAS